MCLLFPEVGSYRGAAGKDQIGVVNGLVVEVVLGREPHCRRFDTDVDVFTDEHDVLVGKKLRQRTHYSQNHVVGLVVREPGGQFAGIESEVLKIQLAASFFVTEYGELHAVLNGAGARLDQSVDRAAHLTRVASDVGRARLVVIKFFERDHRQVDVVLLKPEKAGRIVQQHVGVKHKDAGHMSGGA
jgi:hypothetical protein